MLHHTDQKGPNILKGSVSRTLNKKPFFHFQVVKDENKEKMVPLNWTPSMRLSAWSDMVAHVGPVGSGKQVRAAG